MAVTVARLFLPLPSVERRETAAAVVAAIKPLLLRARHCLLFVLVLFHHLLILRRLRLRPLASARKRNHSNVFSPPSSLRSTATKSLVNSSTSPSAAWFSFCTATASNLPASRQSSSLSSSRSPAPTFSASQYPPLTPFTFDASVRS